MMDKILNRSVLTLSLNKKTLDKLITNNILDIKKLWELSRKDLKDNSFTDQEITNIIIQLQLLGIDLNKKVYFIK